MRALDVLEKGRKLRARARAVFGCDRGFEPVAADQLLFAAPEDLAALAVDERNAPLRVEGDQRGLRHLEILVRAIALALYRTHRVLPHRRVVQKTDETRRIGSSDAADGQEGGEG